MKSLRMTLSAIAVFAVVGSALAFKAKTGNTFATCNLQTFKCTLQPFHSQERVDLINGVQKNYDLFNNNCQPNGTCITKTVFDN